jgi:tetratricopeptide (TPR) repeat protein
MAKKMKVVVRRKEEDEQPPGACVLPFAATSKKTDRRKRSTTPQRRRAIATSSNTSSDPLAKVASGDGATDFSAWEAIHGETSMDQPTPKKSSKALSSVNEDYGVTTFSVGGESSTQPLSYSTTSASQRSPAPSPNRSVENLLTLPTPTDRSNRRRRQYETEKRQMGLYEGELEPVGTRGQEASVKKMDRLDSSASQQSPAVSSKDEPQIRSFDRKQPVREPKNFAGKQIALVVPTSNNQSPHATPDSTANNMVTGTKNSTTASRPSYNTASTSQATLPRQTGGPQPGKRVQPPTRSRPDDSSSESSSQKEMLPPLQLHTGTGQVMRGRVVVDTNSYVPSAYLPRGNAETDDDDDESTQSDEELRRMQPDLMPTFSTDSEPNKPVFSVSMSPGTAGSRMSPAAAAAARAAAATLVRDSNSSESVDLLNKQAMDAVQEGRLNDAVDLFGKVLSIQKSRHGEKHPTVASAYHNLGTVQAKRAAALSNDAVAQQLCRSAALEAFQAAARTARDSLGSTHPNVAVSLVRIGFLLLHSKQYSNALITFAEALRIRLAAFGRNHALTANLYNNLGVCHMHLEEFEQGRRALHTGMGIQRQLCAQSDVKAKSNGTVPWLELADTLFNIGGLCMEWMRKKGPDLRRAQESEDAFAEAYQVSYFLWVMI